MVTASGGNKASCRQHPKFSLATVFQFPRKREDTEVAFVWTDEPSISFILALNLLIKVDLLKKKFLPPYRSMTVLTETVLKRASGVWLYMELSVKQTLRTRVLTHGSWVQYKYVNRFFFLSLFCYCKNIKIYVLFPIHNSTFAFPPLSLPQKKSSSATEQLWKSTDVKKQLPSLRGKKTKTNEKNQL